MAWQAVKEARKKLSSEQGTIFKDWGGRVPIALIYPNSYYLGMSNLGVQTIYGLLNSYHNIVCERVFWEGEGSSKISLESQRPLSDFAVLAFSISYELDYFNVVQMLKSSGIPLLAADRNERYPLVIAGGACIIANPQPLVPFFDCFAIGEAEVILPRLLEVLSQGLEGSRHELLKALSQVPGIYIPNLSNHMVARQWAPDLDEFTTTSVVLTPDTELGDMYLMEASRGCNRGCCFCLTAHAFRPMRPRSLEKLLAQGEVGLRFKKRLGLVGAALSDHPRIDELVAGLRKLGAELSLSSLRVKPLSDDVLKALAESGTRTISLAPEAGSERLRKLINKEISEEDILRAVDKVGKYGLRQLKLYFMIGLPSETEDDIHSIIKLSLACKGVLEKRRAGSQIILNITPFVPKAGTPFQWLPMTTADVLNRRLRLIKSSLRPKGIDIKSESVAWSLVQGVLARGDSKLSAALKSMPRTSLWAWRQALESYNLNSDSYIHCQSPLNERLPWSVLNSVIDSGCLELEFMKPQTKV